MSLLVTVPGTFTSCRLARVWSTASKFFLHHRFAALAVGLLDALLDLVDGLVARQHAADGEEAGLHDGVDAPAHAGASGHFVGVDDVEAQLLLDDRLLGFTRQVIPHLVRPVDAVEQEDAARHGILEHVEALQEGELVAGDETAPG